MKVLVTTLVLALSSIWLAPADAEARSGGYGKKKSKATQGYVYKRRPASVGPNGLCQRDSGTPTGQLNFRKICDTEVFWRRQERGGFGRR